MINRFSSTAFDRAGEFRRRVNGSANRIVWASADLERLHRQLDVEEARHLRGTGETKRAPSYDPDHRRFLQIVERGDAALARRQLLKADIQPDGERRFSFVVSTEAVDRMGDVITAAGWKLDSFRKNPQVLFTHASSEMPIGKSLHIWIEGRKLRAIAEFAPANLSTVAERVVGMLKSGFLSATSVGFRPLKFKFSDDPNRKFGIDFLEQELLEFSIVPIPANPEALIQGVGGAKKGATDQRRRDRLRRLRDSPGH